MRKTTKRLIVLPTLLGLAATMASSAMAGPYRDAVLADSPIAYWGLGETDPSQTATNMGLLGTLADGTYSADAMVGQPTLVLGEDDGSFLASGLAERVTTEPFEKFSDVLGFGGTGFSVEFWTSLASAQAGFSNLVGDGEGGLDFNLMVYAGNGGFIRPHLYTDQIISLDSQRTIGPGEIVHVVSTWDSASGDLTLYLDGQAAAVTQSAGTLPNTAMPINTDNRIYIGQDDREPSPSTWLDEVALYNYPLDANRVLAHYDLGKGADVPQVPVPPVVRKINLSLSTDVLTPGTYGSGHSTPDGAVDIIRQIPNSAAANIVPYTTDDAGPTIDVGPWIVDGGTAGGFGADQHGRGGNLFITGDGEGNTPHSGFGGHANWLITFDLDKVRQERMIGANGELRLTGNYGSWGGIGDATAPAGVTQGLVFVDGVRADNLAETTHNVPTAGGVDSPSQHFDITVPASAKHLTLAIMSGPGSTFWDDGNFRNVRLRAADALLDDQEGLISYWNFDTAETPDSGTEPAQDQPGGNIGMFEGTATRTAGLIGVGAGQFNNAAGDAVNVGPGLENNFSVSDGITIEALIISEWSGDSGDYDEIFRKEDGGNRILFSYQNDAFGGGANPPVEPGPVLSFGLNVGGYGELDLPLDGQDGRPTPEDLNDGNVHHMVATYDAASGEKAIYIDGEKLWSVDLPAGTPIVSGGAANAYIGSVNGGENFTGIIDEVAIWNRALSGEEIGTHYTNVLAGNDYFVPEPGTFGLVLFGILGAFHRLRKRSNRG